MQKFYESRLVIKLSQSSQRVVILCRGEGLEPHIELDRSLVEFSPILPHSPADEKVITVRNPCKFPVEIYNLECDKVYLEEEKVSHLVHICKQLINAKQLCCKQRLWTNKLFLFNIEFCDVETSSRFTKAWIFYSLQWKLQYARSQIQTVQEP